MVGLGVPELIVFGVILVLLPWSLVWQAIAMWHSARHGEKVWFVVFLLLHTAGILEIIYLFAVAKIQRRDGATNGQVTTSGG